MTIAGLNIYYQGLKVEDAFYDHISDRVVFLLEGNKRAFQTLDQLALFAPPNIQCAILSNYPKGSPHHGTNRQTPSPPHNSSPHGTSGGPGGATQNAFSHSYAQNAGQAAQFLAEAVKAAAAGIISAKQYHDLLDTLYPPQRVALYPPQIIGSWLSPAKIKKPEPLERVITSGEVRAFRAWRVKEASDGQHSYLRLQSVYKSSVRWEPGQEMKGDIKEYGVHAFKTFVDCQQYIATSGYSIGTDSFFSPVGMERNAYDFAFNEVYAFGEIALWGEAVEHEMGWRAERAEIKTLISVWGLKAEPAAHALDYLNRVYLKGEPTLPWTIPPPRQIDSSSWTGRED